MKTSLDHRLDAVESIINSDCRRSHEVDEVERQRMSEVRERYLSILNQLPDSVEGLGHLEEHLGLKPISR